VKELFKPERRDECVERGTWHNFDSGNYTLLLDASRRLNQWI